MLSAEGGGRRAEGERGETGDLKPERGARGCGALAAQCGSVLARDCRDGVETAATDRSYMQIAAGWGHPASKGGFRVQPRTQPFGSKRLAARFFFTAWAGETTPFIAI